MKKCKTDWRTDGERAKEMYIEMCVLLTRRINNKFYILRKKERQFCRSFFRLRKPLARRFFRFVFIRKGRFVRGLFLAERHCSAFGGAEINDGNNFLPSFTFRAHQNSLEKKKSPWRRSSWSKTATWCFSTAPHPRFYRGIPVGIW